MCPSSKNVLEANRSDGEQFADRGNQYKPGIFYHNKFQKKRRKNPNDQLKSPRSIVIEILRLSRGRLSLKCL
ncbi:peptide-methionine (S)-S-oxide reductase [Leptospira borgpetersenii]|uniref:peptide-methionine (S)-S-oxide reductase n=1 Tax=Leptospira borgpetersenii TaxID=174 RepID=UPI0018820808|nr:peptide-methionine (S)-S-oxide reductase [Leptospira borgpetersenii serovar Balcanica]MBE8366142.1 peptide-methionine (S)-S-oxide reductase [Leptospira borgpetersenii serovar Balcanica]